MNLEAEDATPMLRRRVAPRVSELESAIEERRRRVANLQSEIAEAPPSADDIVTLLDRLPLLADRLPYLPQAELRALFGSLQMKVTYLPERHVADLELTLVEGDLHVQTSNETAEVWSVPPGESDQTCDARCGSDKGCGCD